MNKVEAKKWINNPSNSLLAGHALVLLSEASRKGKSKSSRLPKAQVIDAIHKAILDIVKNHGGNFDLCSDDKGAGRLLAKYVAQECF